MMSQLTINGKLERLREYSGYLKAYQLYTLPEIREDHTLQGAILHYFQLSIECAIDIGEMIISEHRFRKPQDAREVFRILAEHKVLPQNFAGRFSSAVSFRNILVHEYTEVDLKEVRRHLKTDLKDFDSFARHIARFLNK